MRFSSLLLLPALLCNHSVNAVVSVRAVQPDSLQSKGAVSRRPYRRLYDNASVENTEFLPESINTTVPLRNFQLAVPPVRSTRKSQKCTIELVHHNFTNSWGQPAIVHYRPPEKDKCGDIADWSHIVLNYTATSSGTQYDRLSSVYLGHVEVLRTSTAEPTRGAGIVWTIEKDVTHYARLFSEPGPLLVDLGNGIDLSVGLDGAFDVTLSVTFIRGSPTKRHPDAIIPLSTCSKTQANYFSIDESSVAGSTTVKIPEDTIELYAEIYASGNAREEFWYTNAPDALSPYFHSSLLYRGAFRSVLLYLDDHLARAVFPFPVIFSGGLVPSAWRPMIAYGAFDQPTYRVDLSPWLALYAGRRVNVSLMVEGQGSGRGIYGNWFVSGNLRVYRDSQGRRTQGKMLEHHTPPLDETTGIHIGTGNDSATVLTLAKRQIKTISQLWSINADGQNASKPWYTKTEQDLLFQNAQSISEGGGKQTVRQYIRGSTRSWKNGARRLVDEYSLPLRVRTDYSGQGSFSAEIKLGYNRKTLHEKDISAKGIAEPSKTHVLQEARGEVYLNEKGRVTNGTGSASGRISHRHGASGEMYFRKVKTKGIEIVQDEEDWSSSV